MDKVANSKALDYPEDKLQLIFISDGSSDRTASLLSGAHGILHLHKDKRAGKAAAMNHAMDYAAGEIVVFCDANAEVNPEAMRLFCRLDLTMDMHHAK